jgi:hypothetical protein
MTGTRMALRRSDKVKWLSAASSLIWLNEAGFVWSWFCDM